FLGHGRRACDRKQRCERDAAAPSIDAATIDLVAIDFATHRQPPFWSQSGTCWWLASDALRQSWLAEKSRTGRRQILREMEFAARRKLHQIAFLLMPNDDHLPPTQEFAAQNNPRHLRVWNAPRRSIVT